MRAVVSGPCSRVSQYSAVHAYKERVRLSLAIWTAVVLSAEVAVFVALPGWDSSGDISHRVLFLIFSGLAACTWLAGAIAVYLGRRTYRLWLQRRDVQR